MPIVALYSDGYKELLAGNTRLTAMMAQNGEATVWQFNVPDELNENASYSQHINVKQKIKELTQHMLQKGMNISPLPKVVIYSEQYAASPLGRSLRPATSMDQQSCSLRIWNHPNGRVRHCA